MGKCLQGSRKAVSCLQFVWYERVCPLLVRRMHCLAFSTARSYSHLLLTVQCRKGVNICECVKATVEEQHCFLTWVGSTAADALPSCHCAGADLVLCDYTDQYIEWSTLTKWNMNQLISLSAPFLSLSAVTPPLSPSVASPPPRRLSLKRFSLFSRFPGKHSHGPEEAEAGAHI